MKIRDFLAGSEVTPEFRDSIETFLAEQRPNERIVFHVNTPAIKIERTLTKLLESHPAVPVEKVEIEGASGCEFYRGELRVHAAGERSCVRFEWNCKWKAVQEGWTDYFGFADQTRAANEFGYDCFKLWQSA